MKAIIPRYLHLRRLFFRLRHTTAPDVMAAVRAAAPRDRLGRAALAGWIERAGGFAESAVKLPLDMTLTIEPRITGDPRVHPAYPFGFPRIFRPAAPPEITRVQPRGDLLFQDTHVPAWRAIDSHDASRHDAPDAARLAPPDGAPQQRLRIDELDGARLRLRIAWLSFDDVNLRQPPYFSALRLHFEAADAARDNAPLIVAIPPARLAYPRVGLDPAPRLRGPFFKTLLLDYQLMVTLSPSRSRSVPARPARIRAQPRRHFEEEERTTCCFMH